MTVVRGWLILLTVAWVAGAAAGQFEPNDDFASRAVLDPGVRTVSDSITAGLPGTGPDTTLGALTQTGTVIETDDDSSPLGDGRASALVAVAVNTDGSIRLRVSGFGDFDFDGDDDIFGNPHAESGPFDLTVTVFNGASQVDRQDLAGTLAGGGVRSFDLPGYTYGWTFGAVIDNTPNVGDDVMDFMTFTGLPTGDRFEATITAGTFDPMLGWFDDDGDLIAYDDDGGAGPLSSLAGIVPGAGEVHLAVTGYADDLFGGDHMQSGAYTLEVALVPLGDADKDGDVDLADLSALAFHWDIASGATWAMGDFDDDGAVGLADLSALAFNWQYGVTTPPAVPEPSTLTLLAAGAAAMRRRRRGARRPRT